ncbi:M56 family metallopeptidase [Roseivirga sp. UBA1976]|uniref:M56 family metallopeptidase n=1 Tax=Roseivirga sp. UBA1976 TaxID=1947386 RepID=UPI00257EF743|nr:M56 family metallopeptidase [Roseivirga sp. UBA1976]MEC7752800.1 M56 family metallopeptidase [Bacteroidota bacterium]|tara:strand:+ start:17732 stop:20278 length:2547 start_codon:yes stop_codon:yes gene_type:complete
MEINSNILEAIGLGLVHSLWQGAALLFVVLLGLVSLRNKKAKTRYTLVLMGILALPVLLAGNLYFFWPASPVENSGTLIASEIRFSPNIISDFQAFAENPQSSSTVLWIKENAPTIAVIWIVGMAFFLLKVLGSFIWMKRLLTKAFPLEETSINSLICNIKLVLGIKKPLQIKCSSWIKSPVILGFTRPTVLFPIGLIEGLSTEEVEAILYHELAHLKRNDFVINIIINVLQIVFFYHPAYWWMKSQLDNEREYATDELALKYSEKKLPMIKALAKVQAFSMNQPGLAFAGNSKNQVLKRINIMMNSKQQPNWLSAIFTIALLLVAFGLMSVQETKPKTGKSTEPNTLTESEVDLDSLQNSANPQTRIDYLEFDMDPQPQDDSIAISKAILEMVNNPNDFIFEFDEQGEVVQITKSGKELKRSELSNYKIAYARLIKLGFALTKGAEEAKIEQIQDELRKREEELLRQKRGVVRYNVNNRYEVDSVWLNGKLLEGSDREFHLKNWSLWEREKLEKEYLRLQDSLKVVLYPGNEMDSAEVAWVNKYQAMLAPLEEKLVSLNSSLIENSEAKLAMLEKQIEELKASLKAEKEFTTLAFPSGKARFEFAKVFLVDKIHKNSLIHFDGQFRPSMKLADLTEEDIMSIESMDLIHGSKMLEFAPSELLINKTQILRLNKYKPQAKEKVLKIVKGKPVIELNGKLLKGKSLDDLNLENAQSIEVLSGNSLYKFYSKEELKGYESMIRIYTNQDENARFHAISVSPDNSKYFFNDDSLREVMYDFYILERLSRSKGVLIEYGGKIEKDWTLESLKKDKLYEIKTIELLKNKEMESHYSKEQLSGIDVLLRVNAKN